MHEQLHHYLGTISNGSTRAEDGGDTGFVQEVIVLCGDDTTCCDHDVRATKLLQFFDHLRDERLVSSCKAGDTQHMDIVLDGLFGFVGRGDP